MTRERVLSAATNLYSRYGIKSVSMDHLAGELRISKKTLYEEFENKDGLVCECIEHEFCRIARFSEKAKNESTCALEAIVRICTSVCGYIASVCPAFYKDLKKYMEAERTLEQHKVNLWERSGELLEIGVREGDIMENTDLKLIMTLLIEQSSQIKPPYNTRVVMTLLRGLCTSQGLEKLESYSAVSTESFTKNLNNE